MTRATTVVQVFVGSPSDVKEERDLLESLVSELNKIWSKSLGVIFELIRWETHTYPSFGADPQSIINDQIGDDYDVFIGILWSRFGTPTPRAPSGTSEEFHRAVSRIRDGTPEVMVYFKDAPISPSMIDIEQLKRVSEFRKSISERGLYSVFEDTAGFQSSLRAHFSALAQKYSSKAPKHAHVATVSASINVPEQGSDEDLGYFDYLETFQSRISETVSTLELISDATGHIGEQITLRTKHIQDMSPPITDMKTARKLVRAIAEDMNAYAQIVKTNLPLMTSSRSAAMDALTNALAFHEDFTSNNTNDLANLRSQLLSFASVVSVSLASLGGFRSSVDGLPRMASELNKAKRAVSGQLDSVMVEFNNIARTIENIIQSIDRMLRR